MRLFTLVAAACLAPSFACAASIPVSGTYGSRDACELFKLGGTAAVESGGNSIDKGDYDVEASDFFLVKPDDLVGIEIECRPAKAGGKKATFVCDGEDENFDFETAFREDAKAGTVDFRSPGGSSVTLHRCDP